MTRLVENMFRSRASRLFGLANGQIRPHILTKNAGWFNRASDFLGSGDLSLLDLEQIKFEIEPGEVFVVMTEHHTFGIDSSSVGEYEHDVVDLAKNAVFAVITSQIYARREYSQIRDLIVLSTEEFYSLLTARRSLVNSRDAINQ